MSDLPPPSSTHQAPPRVSDEFRSLRRSRSDRVVAGVLGGLGRRLGIDPVVLRVVTVVLAIFGGVGVLLYVAAWLLVPGEGEDGSVLDHALGRREERRYGAVPLALLLGVVGLIAASGIVAGSWDSGVLFLLAACGLVVLLRRRDDSGDGWRRDDDGASPAPDQTWSYPPGVSDVPAPSTAAPSTTAPSAAPTSAAATEDATATDDAGSPATAQFSTFDESTAPPPPGAPSTGWPDGPDWGAPGEPSPLEEPPAAPAPKPRSVLGPITFCASLVAVGLLAVNDAYWAAVPPAMYVAVPLAVVGAGLLIGAHYGRSRGLIILGILLTIALVPATWASQWRFDNVDVTHVYTSVDELPTDGVEHGAGSVTYDLSGLLLPEGRPAHLTIEQGAGDLTITVPENADVVINASIGAGDIVAFGQSTAGVGQSLNRTDQGPDGPGGGEIVLDIELGVGELEVTR